MILKGSDLVKEYGPKKVVKGVSIEVKKGDCRLAGSNGAGKNHYLLYDCGIIKPTQGLITFG